MNYMDSLNESKRASYVHISMKEFKKLLNTGSVKFKYEKKDGSMRNATGTLKSSLIPDIDKDDERKNPNSDEQFAYYDLDKEGWRSFLIDNFIGIKEEKTKKKGKNR